MNNITHPKILKIYNEIEKEVNETKNKENSIVVIPMHVGDHYRDKNIFNDNYPHRKFTLQTQNKVFSFLIRNDGFVDFKYANILQHEPKQINEWEKSATFLITPQLFKNDFKQLLQYMDSISNDKTFSNYMMQLLKDSIVFPNPQIIKELVKQEKILITQAKKAIEDLKKFYEHEKTYLNIKHNIPDSNIYNAKKDEEGTIYQEENIKFLKDISQKITSMSIEKEVEYLKEIGVIPNIKSNKKNSTNNNLQ